MSARNGRVIGWVLAAALVWMPTASSAAGWIGHVKMRIACPGIGSTFAHEDFTLEMEPGAGVGRLTFVGIGSTDVFTDWNVEGKWGYFSASFNEPDGGPIMFYGWIRGSRLKGYVGIHDYGDGCVSVGKIWAWL